MSAPHPRDSVDPYLEEARTGQSRAATRRALGHLDAGTPLNLVVTDLLAAAQSEAGERWVSGEWSVADEHLATGVTNASLQALGNALPRAGEDGGLVVVACAEGDWHSLPAQMMSELLRADGWTVAFLGGSTPAESVGTLLARQRPVALAVSCSVPMFFGGVARVAAAAHQQGVPVLAGGRAMGTTPRRAERLGADAWASTAPEATRILASWCSRGPVARNAAVLDESALALDARSGVLGGLAFERLATAYPGMATYDQRRLDRTREDLGYIVRFAAASLLVDDRDVFYEFLGWLRVLLNARGVPTQALVAGLHALEPLMYAADERCRLLVEEGLRWLSATPE